MPPMYRVSGLRNVAYTKEELQVYDAKESGKPRPAVTTQEKQKRYKGKIQKFVDDKKVGASIHYLVKWRGLPNKENTWVPRRDMLLVRYGKQFGLGNTKKSIKATFDRLRKDYETPKPKQTKDLRSRTKLRNYCISF